MKICPKCKIEQPHENFYNSILAKDGLFYTCKKCSKAICKVYQNTDIWRKYNREYHREYRKTDKWKNYWKYYYHLNEIRIKKYNKNYRLKTG